MVDKIPAMVDMRLTPEETKEGAVDTPSVYPYGLCISLCNDELEKLNLDTDDVEPGDMLHLHCLASVTSISKRDTGEGPDERVELQIQFISAESEDDENEEADKGMSATKRMSKLYI